MDNTIRVAELFAGVGGFRLGLEGWHGKSPSSGYRETWHTPYRVVWSNQWEPKTKKQHASLIYEHRFGHNGHVNEDISLVDVDAIPNHDLLVGGFPCQDYSVATTLKNAKGLIGKKGVLWWAIYHVLSEKKQRPKYLLLENVDRLLISPSKQRGRDFAIILQSLNQLGYVAEWRVINAADYGMPQRRKRIFILAYLKDSHVGQQLLEHPPQAWLFDKGIIARAFPATSERVLFPNTFKLKGDIVYISNHFNKTPPTNTFANTGVMVDGMVTTMKTNAAYDGAITVLHDVLEAGRVDQAFYISDVDLTKWQYLKGAKKEMRTSTNGYEYYYTEGSMTFPDPLNKPSRTIITGEGGKSPSRFKHVVNTPEGYRRLTPIELERLNMFPDNHTKLEGVSDTKRAFLMGNALVVGVVERIGHALSTTISEAQPTLVQSAD